MKPRHKRWLYFFFFSAAVLCLANTVFLIRHIADFKIDVHDSGNIMLTIIGFLFAFAAINIYSIFNTNVDVERERINELTNGYERLLEEDRKMLGLTKDIVRFQMVIHSISATEEVNGQFLEWLEKATSMSKDFISSLNVIHDSFPDDFNSFHSDVLMVVRDGLYLMEEKNKEIELDRFWGYRDKSIKATGIREMKELIKALEDFDDYDFANKRPFSAIPSSAQYAMKPDKTMQRIVRWFRRFRVAGNES